MKRSDSGFTLVELMVSVVAFSLVSLAAFSVLSSGQRTAVSNDQIVKIQQSVRLALDLMSRDIRMSGYGNSSTGNFPAGCGSQLSAFDANVGADAGPDSISIVTVDQPVGTLAVQAPLPPATSTAIIQVNNLPADVQVGDVITIEGVFTGTVNNVGGGGVLTLSNTIQNPRVFNPGASVIRLVCVTYTVSNAAANPPYQLMRQVGTGLAPNVAVADGIETIQLAYAVDADNDGRIDDQPGGLAGTVDCLDFVPNNTACVHINPLVPIGPGTQAIIPGCVTATPTCVRQVRITVVGRAIPPSVAYLTGNCWRDPSFTTSAQIQAEDQLLPEPSTCGVAGGIRRRALTRVVSLRDTGN